MCTILQLITEKGRIRLSEILQGLYETFHNKEERVSNFIWSAVNLKFYNLSQSSVGGITLLNKTITIEIGDIFTLYHNVLR